MTAVRFLPPPPTPPRQVLLARVQAFCRSLTGRIILGSVAITALGHAGVPLPGVLAGPAWLITWLAVIWAGLRLLGWSMRRILWRIRTKLLLSYLFIAVVPLVLGSVLVLLAALLFTGL